MPSVRPKLVQEGAPVASDDVAMKPAGNLYVIGGGAAAPPPATEPKRSSLNSSLSALNSSMNSLGMSAHSTSGGMEGSSRRSSSTRAKGTSSLARAAKGTFIQDKKPKKSVQHSFVVGGGSSPQDEKKSGDSPYMNDDSGKKTAARPSVTSTSYQIPVNDHSASYREMDMDHTPAPASSGRRNSKPTVQPTAYVIGGAPDQMDITHNDDHHQMDTSHDHDHENHNNTEVEKMEGVIDLSEKPPLCVLDGANIAYAYAKGGGSSLAAEQAKPEPDVKGILVACDYFEKAGIRVLAVIPQTWTIREPHKTKLKKLEGKTVEAPPRDDDDAYAITIARREDAKARHRGDGPGYVMSNDMFRDAAARSKEETGNDDLKEWLTEGSALESGKTGPGRISFAFLDTGSIDDHGDKMLDIMPNPRHPLIQFVEKHAASSAN